MKKTILLFLIFFQLKSFSQFQYIDISTGVYNTTGNLIPDAHDDDTWRVVTPSGVTRIPKVGKANDWAASVVCGWITPRINGTQPFPWSEPGIYTYRTEIMMCFNPTFATIEIDRVGADNELKELRFNGHPYPLNFPGVDDYSPLHYGYSISINPADLLQGLNTIEVLVNNRNTGTGDETETGFTMKARVVTNGVGAGPSITTCPGNCVQIGSPALMNMNYSWTYTDNGNTINAGNTAQITVCPNVITLYTVTATSTDGACVSSDVIKIIPSMSNNPAFTLSTPVPVSGQNYFNCYATPVVTNANTVSGWGEIYMIEELDALSGLPIPGTITTQGAIADPSCWHIYPNPVQFRGYVGTKNVVFAGACKLTPPGKFPFCKRFRITRGTWNSYCSWAQESHLISYCPVDPTKTMVLKDSVDKAAPDMQFMKPANAITDPQIKQEQKPIVYPNPGSGIFTVRTAGINTGSIELYDLSGKLLKQMQLKNNHADTRLHLSGFVKGTYALKLITSDKIQTDKLIIQE